MTNIDLELKLFRTMKRILYQHGQCVWDLLLPIENPDAESNIERYVNFKRDSVKHFSLGAFYREQVGANLPLLTVDYTQLKSSACFPKFSVDFDSYFSTVPPTDCHDIRAEVCNSPEAMLEYKTAMAECLIQLFSCFDINDLDLEDEYKQNFQIVGQPRISNFWINLEVMWFTVSFDITFKNC